MGCLHGNISRGTVHHASNILPGDTILANGACYHGSRCLTWHGRCWPTIDDGGRRRHVVLLMKHGSHRNSGDGRDGAGVLVRGVHRRRQSARICRGDGLHLRHEARPHLAHLGRVLGLDTDVFRDCGAHLVGPLHPEPVRLPQQALGAALEVDAGHLGGGLGALEGQLGVVPLHVGAEVAVELGQGAALLAQLVQGRGVGQAAVGALLEGVLEGGHVLDVVVQGLVELDQLCLGPERRDGGQARRYGLTDGLEDGTAGAALALGLAQGGKDGAQLGVVGARILVLLDQRCGPGRRRLHLLLQSVRIGLDLVKEVIVRTVHKFLPGQLRLGLGEELLKPVLDAPDGTAPGR
mmetsp:Transcript_9812/g.23223  ORF Transcript_9812/g.23223 Transcript_9812/m.23223 type:complete len:350 (-) Transcript_9812:349-1398(-)